MPAHLAVRGPIHLIESLKPRDAIAGLTGQPVLGSIPKRGRRSTRASISIRPCCNSQRRSRLPLPIARLGLTDAMLRLFTDATSSRPASPCRRPQGTPAMALRTRRLRGPRHPGTAAGLSTCGIRTSPPTWLGIRVTKKSAAQQLGRPATRPAADHLRRHDAWISRELYLKLLALGAVTTP